MFREFFVRGAIGGRHGAAIDFDVARQILRVIFGDDIGDRFAGKFAGYDGILKEPIEVPNQAQKFALPINHLEMVRHGPNVATFYPSFQRFGHLFRR